MAADTTEAAAGPATGRFALSRLVGELPATELAPLIARAILVVVLCGFATLAFVNIPGARTFTRPLASVFLLTLLLLQVFYFSNPHIQLRPPTSYLLLTVQAGLVFLPMLMFGKGWLGQPGFLAGTALLVLPRLLAWSLFPV